MSFKLGPTKFGGILFYDPLRKGKATLAKPSKKGKKEIEEWLDQIRLPKAKKKT